MASSILFLILGFVLLIFGAGILIKGASHLALRFGVPTLIVALTIVAFGTSAPELFVSANAALQGSADVAIGNVIGSNIFNILVIVGLSALLCPIKISPDVIKREMPIMIAVLGCFYLAALDGVISRWEGGFFFASLLAYIGMLTWLVKSGKVKAEELADGELPSEEEVQHESILKHLAFIALGLIGLGLGSDWIVNSAVFLAKSFGVSDLVIGVTIVAAGTSLPEVATSCVAAMKKESDLAVGNVVGSNIFNVLAVIGIASLIMPIAVNPIALHFDFPFMFLACVAVWPIMALRRRIGRVGGAILVAVYLGYLFRVLQSGQQI